MNITTQPWDVFINWIIVLAVMLIQGRQATPERNRRSQRQLELGQDQNKPEKCKPAFPITFRVTLFFSFVSCHRSLFSQNFDAHLYHSKQEGVCGI